MTVQDLIDAMEQIAPTRHAEPWDNVGLICGDPASPLAGVSLCIDLTRDVVDEAIARGDSAVIAYHPPIFKDLRRLTPSDPAGMAAYHAVRHGLAVFTPHTALDVAKGGTNDVLGDVLGLAERRPLQPAKPDVIFKVVTYVSAGDIEKVATAMHDAGAGHIGNYDRCSFRLEGTGTFRGSDATTPAVGKPGQLERVDEVRFETVTPAATLNGVLAALRDAHPYEEPAFDVFRTELPRVATTGLGRIGKLKQPTSRGEMISRIKAELGIDQVLICGPTYGTVTTAACCAGSCGDLLDRAANEDAGLYLTGELKHHDALRCQKLGMTAVCVLHSNSERKTLHVLAKRLASALGEISVEVSHCDADPFRMV